MQLSLNRKKFCSFSVASLKSALNFQHFEKKNESDIDRERRGYQNA